jgi:AraC family transcriptional regulator
VKNYIAKITTSMIALPIIKNISKKKLAGLHLSMSLTENKTGLLWQSFMPKLAQIKHAVNSDLISLQVYAPDYFEHFNPTNSFEKWACTEVSSFDDLPEGFTTLLLAEGLYAVFHYKGLNTDTSIFQYIYGVWLPSSSYVLDNRPHFEVLGEKYKNNDVNSEEEIWIPIKLKS